MGRFRRARVPRCGGIEADSTLGTEGHKGTALASGEDTATMLADLAGVGRQVGREQAEVIEAASMPTAGSA